MNIAIVDVAAESGGALSVLMDFLNYLLSLDDDNNEYYIFVSKKIDLTNNRFHVILKPAIKISWFSRLKWELIEAKKEFTRLKINTIISLQNTGFFFNGFSQVVYFHNVLLLENASKYSLMKKEERKYALYTRLIAPYTMRSMKKANTIICQTNVVKEKLITQLPQADIVVIPPNVHVDECYINKAVAPIKGFIYPTTAVPFKRIEDIIICVRNHIKWFEENNIEVLITISGNETEYAKSIFVMAKGLKPVRLIGYQSRESILKLYKDHALIINSELESYPLLFQEKNLVGGPIIAADYQYAIEITKGMNGSKLYLKRNINGMFEMMKWAYSYDIGSKRIHHNFNNSWEILRKILMQSR